MLDRAVQFTPIGFPPADRPAAGPDVEQGMTQVLEDLLDRPVTASDHFFDDLGANSLVMAHFCAKVRKRDDLPTVSIRDIYAHPTIEGLAVALAPGPAEVAESAETSARTPASPRMAVPVEEPLTVRRAPRGRQMVACGVGQAMIYLAYTGLIAALLVFVYAWISEAEGIVDVYLRSALAGGLGFVTVCLLPVLLKWLLVGRWKATQFPVWGPAYLRFWTVKVLLHANPVRLFKGSPVYGMYLRALGARVGRGALILSPELPVCTDLLTIGSGAVIRQDAHLLCYRAHDGMIQTGPVTIGRDAYVGEQTILEVGTVLGDGAQLGHGSSLHRGQEVPAGETWHGSPAEPVLLDYVQAGSAACSTVRRATYAIVSMLQVFLIYVPFGLGGLYMLFIEVPALEKLLHPADVESLRSGEIVVTGVLLSLTAYVGALVAGLVVIGTVPRLLNLMMTPDVVYPLYGLHYSVHRVITRLTNSKTYLWMFGDSSYVVPYLSYLGYDLTTVEQTGSNFGSAVRHETPFHVRIGQGTMVADGLSIVNASYSATAFRVSLVDIGPHNFLGNAIPYPAGGRTGENCLLATKVSIPLDGPVREDVGLLGSPSFEIPRSVERDRRFDHLRSGPEHQRRLGMKNRYNLRSMALHLTLRWLHLCAVSLIGLVAVELSSPVSGALGWLILAVALASVLPFTALTFTLIERTILRFRPMQPKICSIYDPYFWWHERTWKVMDSHLAVLNGTPFKNIAWRLLGVRLGKRVFDDGIFITERTLTTIGDDCTLSVHSKVQCHSQEDGTFKSDRTRIGNGCTIGTGALVHYGVTIGDEAIIAADSFVMKGEDVPAGAVWGGNPATEVAVRTCDGSEPPTLSASEVRGAVPSAEERGATWR